MGGSDGYVKEKVPTGIANVLVETHDLMGMDSKAVNEQKVWTELKYALNTGGGSVTLQFYVDDVLMQWPDGTTERTVTGISEATQVLKSFPENWKGYRMRIVITGTEMAVFELYSPWTLKFDVNP